MARSTGAVQFGRSQRVSSLFHKEAPMRCGMFARSCASLLITVGLLICGCATQQRETGRPILDNQVSKIVKGQTTVNDVITMFGAPTSQTEMAGKVLYTYRHTKDSGSTGFMPYYT